MNKNQKSVSDLGAAAYLLMHNLKVMGRQGKEIYFKINDTFSSDQFEQLTLDYLSSEFHRFDSCIMSLKKVGEYNFNPKYYKSVNDLGAAAYILMHKYKIAGRRGKTIYFEVDSDSYEKFDKLSLDYISSDFHKFDSCLMSLKKIAEYVSE